MNTNTHTNGDSTIAQLDATATVILKTFGNLETAKVPVGLREASTLTLAIQRGTKAAGFFWKRYDDCDPAMRGAFIASGGVVVPPIKRGGKAIAQLDATTRAQIKVFATITDACRDMRGSHKEFGKSIANNTVYKGSRWQMVVPALAEGEAVEGA